MALSFALDAPEEFDSTIFPAGDDSFINKAAYLVTTLNQVGFNNFQFFFFFQILTL
jgi:hypothetical protein